MKWRARRAATALALGVAVVGPLAFTAPDRGPGIAITLPKPTGDPTDFFVLAKPGAQEKIPTAIRAAGGTVTSANDTIGLYRVTAPANGFAQNAARFSTIQGTATYAALDQHVIPEPDEPSSENIPATHQITIEDITGPENLDPFDVNQWNLRQIGADITRDRATGAGVTVGIIDSGVDARHPDIAPNYDHELSRNFTGADTTEPCPEQGCEEGADVDGSGHGTYMAGIVAAAANDFGTSGVAPDARIVSLRVGDPEEGTNVLRVANALVYAGNAGIDVVNVSLAVQEWLDGCGTGRPATTQDDRALAIEAMARALRYAKDRGTTVVAALGNEAVDFGQTSIQERFPTVPLFPAAPLFPAEPWVNSACTILPAHGDGVISVIAVGPSGAKTHYSNYGLATPRVIAAPGGNPLEVADSIDEFMALQGYGGILAPTSRAGYRKNRFASFDGCEGPDTACYYTSGQGTSPATPHVVGVIALLLEHTREQGEELSPERIWGVLQSTADRVACPPAAAPRTAIQPCTGKPGQTSHHGAGIVNADRALRVTLR